MTETVDGGEKKTTSDNVGVRQISFGFACCVRVNFNIKGKREENCNLCAGNITSFSFSPSRLYDLAYFLLARVNVSRGRSGSLDMIDGMGIKVSTAEFSK